MLTCSLYMNHSKSIYQNLETVEEIKELALKYLDKYQPSKKSLQVYLFRKAIDGQSNSVEKSEILKKIEIVINDLEEKGILNDTLYSEIKSQNFLKRGYSLNKIKQHLSQKGISQELLKQTIEKIQDDNTNPDFYSAIRICKKRRIGPYRPDANKEIFYKKDMGVLARSGFSYDLSKEVLALDKKQLKIYEKKL
jgi:regulatory protein